MALLISQYTGYNTLPAAQEIIYVLSEDGGIVANETRVKFIAEVFISSESVGLVTSANSVAVLKTTPNASGVGMFDLRPIIETNVNADNQAKDNVTPPTTTYATYKQQNVNPDKQVPMHLIDRYSLAPDTIKWVQVVFDIEYLDSSLAEPIIVQDQDYQFSDVLLVFNGYVGNEDTLTAIDGNFGYQLDFANYIQNDTDATFLTNAPTTQYARLSDYGTVAMFNLLGTENSFLTGPSGVTRAIQYIEIKLYDSAGAQLGATRQEQNTAANGGEPSVSQYASDKFLFFGCYPANFTGSNFSAWITNKADVSYYTIQAFDTAATANAITQLYTINIICDNSFGYEGIRLTWLNKLGAWDYYTFNQKSIRSLTTNKSTYSQLGGTWNKASYMPSGYRGGNKAFRVNSKERIRLNTDFLTDAESIWIEELLNSPEVYILNGESTDSYEGFLNKSGIINKYVEPVLVTTSSFIRKTKANDKLIQYTIEIERNKDQRTQAV